MQTILGAGGAIGMELAKALTKYTPDIRLVSRNPERVNPTDELMSADLLNYDQLQKAIENSSVAYVTIGFAYDYKIWKQNWPNFISNVIDICKKEECKLVFFDNVYMYDAEHMDRMTEKTPINPPSKKGKIRAEIADMILNTSGNFKTLIARSADFYGPSINNTSILTQTVLDPLSNGKKANCLGNSDCKHSFTYTIDAGQATALLGNTEEAYNQIWHLPTAPNPPTGKEWVELAAKVMGVDPKYRSVSKFWVRMLGLFIPEMREMVEMMYQYNQDYIFDSSKFENQFDFTPTPYSKGIKEIIASDYRADL